MTSGPWSWSAASWIPTIRSTRPRSIGTRRLGTATISAMAAPRPSRILTRRDVEGAVCRDEESGDARRDEQLGELPWAAADRSIPSTPALVYNDAMGVFRIAALPAAAILLTSCKGPPAPILD